MINLTFGNLDMVRSALDFLQSLESWDFTVQPTTGILYSGKRNGVSIESLIDFIVTDQGIRTTRLPRMRVGPSISHRAISMNCSIQLPVDGNSC